MQFAVAVQFQQVALDTSFDPAPTFGTDFLGGCIKLLRDQALQQLSVGNIARVFVVTEQVATHIATRCLVGEEANETHETASARVDLGAGDRLPQIVRLTLPLVCPKPEMFLGFVVIREGERG